MPASHGLRITLGVFKMFIGAHLVVTNLFSALPAQGPSMLPSFAIFGEWLGTDMRCRLGRGVGVGDLVMYRIPIKRNDVGVKRIIGMPGDYVLAGTPGQPGQKTMIQVGVSYVSESAPLWSSLLTVCRIGTRRPLLDCWR